jgi:tetratricopeptide (TPR) repeat protein
MPRFRIVAWLLALITVAIYLPVRSDGFVYDDYDYIVRNPIVANGLSWAGIQWAFTTSHAALWHPLTWISLMLDCQLFGLNPGALHVVNVLFHAANAVLLLLLLFRLTGDLWPSAFAAALFAWHPLRVESVAWIVERKDVLSTFFALLSLLAYERFAREKPAAGKSKWSRNFVLALVFFMLALMAKPLPVTLPFVFLLLDFWPLQRFSISDFRLPVFGRLVREKWPFFVVVAASCLVSLAALKHGQGGPSFQELPLDHRLENIPVAYALYLFKMLWPAKLAVLYPLPETIPAAAVAGSVAVLAGISLAVWLMRKTGPWLLVGWLWFLGTLFPAIGLVQVGAQALADRYSYFSLIGIGIAIAFGLRQVVNRRPASGNLVVPAAILVFAGCIIMTEIQLTYWRDNKSLFLHALEVAPDNPSAHLWVGMAYQDDHDYKEALFHFHEAERLAPGFLFTHFTIAGLLADEGKPNEALDEYRQALRIKPDDPGVLDRYGLVLVTVGHYDEAAEQFIAASRADPGNAQPHFHLARLFAMQGKDAAAVPEFHEAVRLDPDNPQILAHAAELLAASEDPQVRNGSAALALALKADTLTGNSQPSILDVLGMAFAETGDFDNAQQAVHRALDLAAGVKPDQLTPLWQRLARYQAHQPWRQSFKSTKPSP